MIHNKQYSKKMPSYYDQVDVKFLKFKNWEEKTVKRYQYTAIDNMTRVQTLQIYPIHYQDCAIKLIDYVIKNFSFHSSTVRTDRGHEFQVHFNGKVEWSHRTDQSEFYQLLTCTDDVDLNVKLEA